MTQLKSLVHPDWPYAGTAHEWRGFVKRDGAEIDKAHTNFYEQILDQPRGSCVGSYNGVPIFQKMNFGPNLD